MLDDVHWADASSLAVLRFVLDRLIGRSVAVIGIARDGQPRSEERSRLQRQSQSIVLTGVTPDDIVSISLQHTGRALAPAAAAALHQRTGGNPLFVRELLAAGTSRLSGATGELLGHDQPRWMTPDRTRTTPCNPPTEATVAARLGGINPHTRKGHTMRAPSRSGRWCALSTWLVVDELTEQPPEGDLGRTVTLRHTVNFQIEEANMGRVVVGVDESTGAAVALRWAQREADVRRWSLIAVLAWGFLEQHHVAAGQPFDPAYDEADAVSALESIVAGAADPDCAVTIEQKVVSDLAARALLDESVEADLLVVGARGLGGFRGLLLGSVSQQCLQHARCPVAVLRDDHRRYDVIGRIVVGIDGSDTARQALEWAVLASRVHGANLEVVHAMPLPYVPGVGIVAAAFDITPVEDAARRTLDAAVDSVDTDGLPAPAIRTLSYGSAPAAILEAADGAELVVVGSRGLGGFKGAVLGSVSHNITHRATCPVVVVPPAGE